MNEYLKTTLIEISFLSIIVIMVGCYSENSNNDNFNEYNALIKLSRKYAFEDQDYSKAIESYKLAFEEIKNPFGLDYINALEIASLNNNYEFGTEILKEISKRGCPKKLVKNYSKKYLKYDEASWNKFAASISTYEEYYKSNFDKALRLELLDLRKLDSTFNLAFHTAPLDSAYAINTTKEISRRLSLFETQGEFPSESNVGLFYNEEEVVQSPITVVLLHQYQRGDTIFLNRLNEFVEKGFLEKSNGNMFKEYLKNKPIGIEKPYARSQMIKWRKGLAKKRLEIEFIDN